MPLEESGHLRRKIRDIISAHSSVSCIAGGGICRPHFARAILGLLLWSTWLLLYKFLILMWVLRTSWPMLTIEIILPLDRDPFRRSPREVNVLRIDQRLEVLTEFMRPDTG